MAAADGEWASAGSVRIGTAQVERLLVRVPLVRPGQDLLPLLEASVKPAVRSGDVVFISEKVVAISQGRVVGMWQIRARPMAHLLSRFVRRTPHGLGVGQPIVMEMAMREAGVPRILLAALIGGVTRAVGRGGDFYRIAGRKVAAIDGPNRHTIKPYGYYVVLAPTEPDAVAERLAQALGAGVAVVDCNDLGSEVLGASDGVDREFVRRALKGNPMGQGNQRTPIGILRREPGA